MGQDKVIAAQATPGLLTGQPAMLYSNAYAWFVIVSALDVMFTGCVLALGGFEMNYLAALVIWRWDIWGLILYKFSLVILVIVCCEEIGRQRPTTGKNLALFAVIITSVPVILGAGLIAGAIHLGW
jgi:hypothetical protein